MSYGKDHCYKVQRDLARKRVERLESAIRHALKDTLWNTSGRKLNLEKVLKDV